MYADVIVDISHEKLDRPFQYRVPEHLQDVLEVGMCVQVPFGNGNKVISGYVTGLGEECKFDPARMKEVAGVVSGSVSVETPAQPEKEPVNTTPALIGGVAAIAVYYVGSVAIAAVKKKKGGKKDGKANPDTDGKQQ